MVTGTRRPDHPHAGGENVVLDYMSQHGHGPSPRGWGELSGLNETIHHWRTIPTRVGRTHPITITLSLLPDHPHAGGENTVQGIIVTFVSGPSPRGWGELLLRLQHAT